MQRRIVGFVIDDVGDWVAQLECHHRQHVRHQPPFRNAAWVVTEEGRQEHIGTTLGCPLCARCELPAAELEVRRTTPTWDETTVPDGLRRNHRVASGVWGRIRVESGSLRFVAQTEPVTDVVVRAGATQPIPPDVEHHVEPGPTLRFAVEFLAPPA